MLDHCSQDEDAGRTLSQVHLLENKDISLGKGIIFCMNGKKQLSVQVAIGRRVILHAVNTTLGLDGRHPP